MNLEGRHIALTPSNLSHSDIVDFAEPCLVRKIEIDDDKKLYPLFDKRMAQEAEREN